MSCKHGVDLAYPCSACSYDKARSEDSYYYYKRSISDGGISGRDYYYPPPPPVPVTQDDIRVLRSEVFRLTQLVEKLIGIFSPDQAK